MKLVNEDKNGAYLGVTQEFLKKFISRESNPNFDVFDSRDGFNRLVFAKSSRLPDDNCFSTGRYAINYHRQKPDYDEAFKQKEGMKNVKNTRHLLNDLAFVAATPEEYGEKAAAWDRFYSYIWGAEPMTVWVTPHSGAITRPPDYLIPWPQQEADAYVAGVAALCALNNTGNPTQRIMMSIHSHNWLGAVLDVGNFGIVDEAKLDAVLQIINSRYHDGVQSLAGECRNRFRDIAMDWVNYVMGTKNTLNPRELNGISTHDEGIIKLIIKSLKLYGGEITRFTANEFDEAIDKLTGTTLQAMSVNHLFSGQHICGLIGLREKIRAGQMGTASQVECSKLYLEKAPGLVSAVILDVKKELFG
jgi:hypothetical protein